MVAGVIGTSFNESREQYQISERQALNPNSARGLRGGQCVSLILATTVEFVCYGSSVLPDFLATTVGRPPA
jgi:hypothetical protein